MLVAMGPTAATVLNFTSLASISAHTQMLLPQCKLAWYPKERQSRYGATGSDFIEQVGIILVLRCTNVIFVRAWVVRVVECRDSALVQAGGYMRTQW